MNSEMPQYRQTLIPEKIGTKNHSQEIQTNFVQCEIG